MAMHVICGGGVKRAHAGETQVLNLYNYGTQSARENSHEHVGIPKHSPRGGVLSTEVSLKRFTEEL